MYQWRTDLALERLEGLENQTIPGIESRAWRQSPLSFHSISILDKRGEQALCRPAGRYLTAEM